MFNIRGLAFWTIDKLRGSATRNQLNEIKDIIENYPNTKGKIQVLLDEFLDSACSNTKFYAPFKGKSLGEFPVIKKDDLRKDRPSFLSNKFSEEDLIGMRTSGSYGTPFEFLLSRKKKLRQRSEVIYFGEWAHYYVGTKHIYMRANDNKSKLKLFLQNETFIKTDEFGEEWLERQRQVILNSGAKVIISFPSSLAAIAKYALEKGNTAKDFKVEGVIISGETLLDQHRKVIEELFGAPCHSRYSTEELGVIANECKYRNHHINLASYHVEVLKMDSDEPVEDGEIGRIIVTDFFSHAMPLIRYETGDLGVFDSSDSRCKCGICGPVLKSVEGRQMEVILTPDGRKLSPFFVNPIMSYTEHVSQFQFVQTGAEDYVLKVVGDLSNSDRANLNKRYLDILGDGANFVIDEVEAIETLRSGKRAYVVNEYSKKQKL